MRRNILICLGVCMLALFAAGGWYAAKWDAAKQEVATVQVSSGELSLINCDMADTISVKKGPDMLGRVKSIKDDKVVLDLVQMPDKPAAPPTQGERQNKIERMRSLKLTGETATITVPKDVPLMVGKPGETARQIQVSDLQVGDFVLVWHDSAGGADKESVIRRIRVIQLAT